MERLRLLVKTARLKMSWSQREAGRRTGFERRVVSELESGKRRTDLIEYAFALAMAAEDWRLAKQVVQIVAGAPLAGVPMPDGVDGHPLAIKQLVGQQLRDAMEAFDGIDYWKPPTEAQQQRALRALADLFKAISTCGWLFEAVCRQFGVDGRQVMREPVEVLGMPRTLREAIA